MLTDIVSHGMDYMRVRAPTVAALEYLARETPYVDIKPVWHHGTRYVDYTGRMLETVRCFDDLSVLAVAFADMFGLGRIDYYVDVAGRHLSDVLYRDGTVIANGNRVETIYSTHLSKRGDVLEFCRAYDAMAAGHYDFDVTRFEIEWKGDAVQTILSQDDWIHSLVEYAVGGFETYLKARVLVPDVSAMELNPARTVLEHSRERFYRRYGKSILSDIEAMGLQKLFEFVQTCVRGSSDDKANS